MIQWTYIPKDSKNRGNTTYRWNFIKSFKRPPFFSFAVMEKGSELNEGNFYGWTYTGTWHASGDTYTNGIFSNYVTFSRWGDMTLRAVAIGEV